MKHFWIILFLVPLFAQNDNIKFILKNDSEIIGFKPEDKVVIRLYKKNILNIMGLDNINQAIQREFLLNGTDDANPEDYIFFSDPDEIPNPKFLKNFELKKKYGIFMQRCFNYKFNLF